MSRKLVNVRINNAGLCIEGWVDTGVCDPIASRPIYTAATGGTVIAGAVITPAGACPKEVVVSPSSATPIPATASGVDCTGLTVTATGAQGQLVQTVPHPSAVQLVKICGDKPRFDREMVTLCAPDGTKVVVQNVTPEDAVLGAAPIFEAWNLNGTPYTGTVSALVDCGADKVNTEHTDYCAGGTNYTRVDGLAEGTGLPVWTLWLDDAGAPVAQPVGAVKGVCTAAARVDAYSGYKTSQIDEAIVGTTYIRKAGPNTADSWLIQRIMESGTDTTLTYAGIHNNSAITAATAAWASRATLVYGEISAA